MDSSLQTIINMLCEADEPARQFLSDITVSELLGALHESQISTSLDTVT